MAIDVKQVSFRWYAEPSDGDFRLICILEIHTFFLMSGKIRICRCRVELSGPDRLMLSSNTFIALLIDGHSIWFIIESIKFYTIPFYEIWSFRLVLARFFVCALKWFEPRKLKFNHRETIHGRKHIKINHKILLATVCASAGFQTNFI